MNLLEKLSPVNYEIIHIDDKDYFFPSLEEDEVYDRISGNGYPCESVSDFICVLAEHFWNKETEVFEKIKYSTALAKQVRNAEDQLTVAIYYRNIINGGAQRIVAMLANLWADHITAEGRKKYKVILVTDYPSETPSKSDDPNVEEESFDYSVFLNEVQKEYALSDSVEREYLPPYKLSAKEKYRERQKAWYHIIEKHSVDIVVSGMWISTCTFWDMLSIKAHPNHPAFIMHNHNFACVPYLAENDSALRLLSMYQMCDGIVVLSETDKKFVEYFSDNVLFIPNPKPVFDIAEKTERTSKNILWIGRIAKEKRPLDAIKAFRKVLERIPDAKLYMVGSGELELIRQLVQLIHRYNIEEHVILPGFTLDVDKYYQSADVFISTSMYEGFPTTATEAFSFSVPIVEYEMPWLYYSRDSRGIVSVPQGDCNALAEEIIDILENPKKAKAIGILGKEKVDEINESDILDLWDSMFDRAVAIVNNINKADLLMQYVTKYQSIVKNNSKNHYLDKIQRLRIKNSKLKAKLDSTNKNIKVLRETNKKLIKERNKLINSKAYRLSKTVTKPFDMIKKIVK